MTDQPVYPGFRVLMLLDADGNQEMFTVRISEEGVADWLAHREELRRAGKPDRPPDVDLPTLRAWVPHPGEEQHPYFAAHTLTEAHVVGLEPETWPVFTVSWRDERVVAQFRLMAVADGDLTLRVVMDDLQTGARIFDVGRDFTMDDGDAIDDELADLVDRLPTEGMKVSVATVTDYEEVEAEMAAAQADVVRGFISTGPTVVQ